MLTTCIHHVAVNVCADASAAAQLLHAAVLQFMSDDSMEIRRIDPNRVAAIMCALCTLPSAEHMNLEVYAVILQLFTHKLDLYTAVKAMPQAQKLSSPMICDLLVAATQREQYYHVIAAGLLR